MKKIFLRTLSSLAILLMALCIKPISVFAAELPSELLEQMSQNEFEFLLLHDDSWSMQNTFSWESSIINEKLDDIFNPCDIHDNYFWLGILFGNNSSSNIWNVLNKYGEVANSIFLVSDLWNTDSENLQPASNKNLIIMVPYYSDYSDGKKHVEDVITNVILQSWTNSTVTVCYLDNELVSYSNSERELGNSFDEPISNKEAAEITATSITEEVEVDESIPRDSVVVFDISGSMSDFMQRLYDQLHEMTTTQKIESMYAFSAYVSDEISPEQFNEELWNELDLGATSNIIGGLRTAAQNNPSAHIYLITDLLNNENYWKIDENFSGLITIIEYYSETLDDFEKLYINDFYDSVKQNYPNAESITRIRAN